MTDDVSPSRVVSSVRLDDDDQFEAGLRPRTLDAYIGQERLRENLEVSIAATRQRAEALDHVLLYGPPGLGKTTLAYVIANELGVPIRTTAGPVLEKPGDLAAILTNLKEHEVLFIDEIHRMSPVIEEILYPAMEDFQLDLIIGEGPGARSVRIDIAPFTLVGATTRSGLVGTPLRDRFGIQERLRFYRTEELEAVVGRGARVLDMALSDDGAHEIARRARGTPRVAGRLLRRVRDFATIGGADVVDAEIAGDALSRLAVDSRGLDAMDRRYLACIADNYGGGPVGVETLAAALSEERDTIEDVIEPYLMQQGFLARTPRGRVLTQIAWQHIERTPSQAALEQLELLGPEGGDG